MYFRLSWVPLIAFLGGLICTISAKPLQNGNSEQTPVRRLDTLSGFTIGSNKATRSMPEPPRGSLDNLGDGNYLRSLDSIGGNNYLRSLDSIGGGNLLRDLDSIGGSNFLRALDSLGAGNVLRQQPQGGAYDYRSLDSLGGGNLIRSLTEGSRAGSGPARAGKRLDTLSGLTLGHQKRNFDEVDRTAFDGFNKRNFDEIDRVGFDGFSKREARSVGGRSDS